MTWPNIPTRPEVLQSIGQRFDGFVAVLPIHYSRALVRAFDWLPIEVWSPRRDQASATHPRLQTYTCSVVHNALAAILRGDLNQAKAIIVPHTCDSLQGLTGLLTDFCQLSQPVLPLYLPRAAREQAVPFLAAEYRALFDRLSQIAGRRPSEEALHRAIDRETSADQLLGKLAGSRRERRIAAADYYRLVRSREYLPAEDFSQLAESALAASESRVAADQTKVGVLLSGMLLEPLSVIDLIEEAGGTVVADDLGNGSRRIYSPSTASDPFARMAERLLSAPADPAFGSSVEARAEHLVSNCRHADVRAAIFYTIKFCEPELFYIPLLRKELERNSIRSLCLEIDLNDLRSEQLATRFEALIESLQ